MNKVYTIRIDEDADGQTVEVFRVGRSEAVTSVTTVYDCPEDNTVRRLGLDDFAKDIITDLGGTVED